MAIQARERTQVTITEAAHLLGVSVSTLRNWDRLGKLKPHRHPLNRYRMYDRKEIERLKHEIEGN